MTSPYGSYEPNPNSPNPSHGEQPAPQNPYPSAAAPHNYGGYYGQPSQQNSPMYGHGAPQGKPRPHVGFGQAIRNHFKYLFHFSGRASRSEYWWVALFWMLIGFVLIGITFTGFVVSISNSSSVASYGSSYGTSASEQAAIMWVIIMYIVTLLFALIQTIAMLAISWRRVQDTGNHGAISLIQLVGIPVMLVFGFMKSSPDGYQYDKPGDLNRP